MSSLPVRLDKALRNGIVRHIRVLRNEQEGPPPGHNWLVLAGDIYHVTATDTSVEHRTADNHTKWVTRTDTGEVTGHYPLFNTLSNVKQSQFNIVLVKQKEHLRCTGGVACYVDISVLEWTL